MAWMDNTGLYQKYGTEQTVTSTGGEYKTFGEHREIELRIDLTTLTEAETIINDNIFFPVGCKIESVQIYTETAAATGAAIDLGFVRTDRTTEIDYDGVLAAVATATMTVGSTQQLIKGSTGVGALITNGTALTNVGQITCSRTTATAFTAGVIKVRIRYERP
jgi:hypothetical protein